jgi:hypothetical protein
MDKLLDTCNQPELNQEDINHLNSRITCNEIEAVIVSLQRKPRIHCQILPKKN